MQILNHSRGMRRDYWAIDGPGSILCIAYLGNDAGK